MREQERAAGGAEHEPESSTGADAGVAPVKAAGSGDPDDLHSRLGGGRGRRRNGAGARNAAYGVLALYVVIGATPFVLMVTGLLMYWNRSFSKKWRRAFPVL